MPKNMHSITFIIFSEGIELTLRKYTELMTLNTVCFEFYRQTVKTTSVQTVIV